MTEDLSGVSDKRADDGWKVGQRAVINRKTLVTIERVTPSGRAVADGRTFEVDGRERSSSYRRSNLELLTPEIEEEMALASRGLQAAREAREAIHKADMWIRKSFGPWGRIIPEASDVDAAEKLAAAIREAINDGQ